MKLGTGSHFNTVLTVNVIFRIKLRATLGVNIIASALPGANVDLPFFDCNNASLVVLLVRVKVILSMSECSQVRGWGTWRWKMGV